ncbi:MAG: DUF4418 family protein [Anaerolineales bacterium]
MKIIGAVLIVLSLVVAIVPMFTDCQSQGRAIVLENGKTIPMKCHWSGLAELVVAVPLFVLGVMDIINRNLLVFRYLSIMGIVLGIFIILIPTNLIGVCISPEMLCSSVMRPILILAGILVVVANLAGVWISFKSQNKLV